MTQPQQSQQRAGGMTLLPAAPGTCPFCAVRHPSDMPHDKTSLFYTVRFLMQHGREATWADAAAHCTPRMRAYWRQALEDQDHVWSDPPCGFDPIAEPVDDLVVN